MNPIPARRRSAGGAVLLLLLALVAPPAQGAGLGVRYADGRTGPSLPVTRLEPGSDEYYVAANALASALELERFWRADTRKLVLKVKQRRLQVTVDTRLVLAGDQEILLRVPVRYQKGSVMLPLEFLERVLVPALGGGAALDRATLRLSLGSGDTDITGIDYQPVPEGLEVRLLLGRALHCTAQANSDELVRVVLAGGKVDPLALAADRPAPLLRSVRAEQAASGAIIYLQVEPPLGGLETRSEDGDRTVVITLRRGMAAPEAGRSDFVRPMVEMPPAGVDVDSFDIVAIDAGHGGFDSGARGGGLLEKDVTLQVATQLQTLLGRELGVRVLLLRSGDATLAAETRAELANRARADALISLHCNAWFGPEARGFAVAYVTPAGSTRDLAAMQSAEQGLTEFVPWNAAGVPFAPRSKLLAEQVEAALGAALGLPGRGLRTAPLEVLQGAAMPSVLIEMGFLTSAEDVARLSASDFAPRLAAGLAAALRGYKQELRTAAAPGSPAVSPRGAGPAPAAAGTGRTTGGEARVR